MWTKQTCKLQPKQQKLNWKKSALNLTVILANEPEKFRSRTAKKYFVNVHNHQLISKTVKCET